jgi:peroxiredoxin
MVCAIVALAALAPVAVSAAEASGTPRIAPDFRLQVAFGADTLQLADFRDAPVLLVFFDAGNVPTRRCLPYANEWYRRYENDGLRIIGIHCPEIELLKDRTIAETAIANIEVRFPVCLDMASEVFASYSLDGLFAFVLVQPGGEIVYETSAPRSFRHTEEAIQDLLKTLKPDTIMPFILKPLRPEEAPDVDIIEPTPTIVLGYGGNDIFGCDSTDFGSYRDYEYPVERQKDKVYLQGSWKVDQRSISYRHEARTSEGRIRLIYSGKDVWLLPAFDKGPVPRIYVKYDRSYIPNDLTGKDVRFDSTGLPFIHLRYPVPVHVVRNSDYGAHELELIVTGADATFYYLFFEGAAVR